MKVRVITVSDRSAQGLRADTSGPLLAQLLGAQEPPVVVPDDASAIARAVQEAALTYDLVVTTGGTGVAPRDVTPDAVGPLLDKELPGIMEAIRADGRAQVATAALSRGVAGTLGSALVITLPGSTGGVRDGAKVVLELAQHVLDQLAGHDH